MLNLRYEQKCSKTAISGFNCPFFDNFTTIYACRDSEAAKFYMKICTVCLLSCTKFHDIAWPGSESMKHICSRIITFSANLKCALSLIIYWIHYEYALISCKCIYSILLHIHAKFKES